MTSIGPSARFRETFRKGLLSLVVFRVTVSMKTGDHNPFFLAFGQFFD